MRRLLAIALLIAFGSPMVAPVFAATADPQASLPACCRRHGAHHCTMSAPGGSGSPAFQAPPCPLYPSAATVLRLASASISSAAPATVELMREAAPGVPESRRKRTFETASHYTRGPPARLA